jgi:hypothetical protein
LTRQRGKTPRLPARTRAAEAAGEKIKPADVTVSSSEAGRLSNLIAGKPQSKFGQLRQLWPDVKAALRAGHQLKQVWECLVQDGIDLSWSKFRTYIVRLRRLEAAGADLPNDPAQNRDLKSPTSPNNSNSGKRDPLANLRERMNQRPGFEFDERPPDMKKLI